MYEYINKYLQNKNLLLEITPWPLVGERINNLFWGQMKRSSRNYDVILFICTDDFVKNYVNEFIQLSNFSEYSKSRFIYVYPDELVFDDSIISNNDLVLKSCVLEDDKGGSAEFITKIIDYIKVLDRLKGTEKSFSVLETKRKFKRINSLLFMSLGYIMLLIPLLAATITPSSFLNNQLAQILLFFMMVLGISFLFYGFADAFIINRKELLRVKDRMEFNAELDSSLAGPRKTHSRGYKNSKKEEGNNESQTNNYNDSFGDNEYQPLGHLSFNWKQMKGYYDISKSQATNSFRWAIVFCFIGIAIILFAVLSPLIPAYSNSNSLIPILGTICGAFVELFAGTILVVYVKSLSQMNLYHQALSKYQQYLSCVNLVSKISSTDKQDLLYEKIIITEIKHEAKLDTEENK